jgi:hypothetical protein
MRKVSYIPYNIESYGLVYDNEVVAELNVGEDAAIEIVLAINEFLFKHDTEKKGSVVIQNDSSYPYLGVIVDIYNSEEHVDNIHFMFDDFIDE